MPAIIHTDLADIAGAGLTKGSVTYVARREGASTSGAATMILPIAHPVQIVDGLADSPPLQPGPAVVIVQSGYFYREYPVTVPDDNETYNLLELAEVEIDWDPHIVSKIAQYVADAQTAVGQAQEILDDVESGVVPDPGIAARIAESGSATRTAVEDRVRAVGDGTYAPQSGTGSPTAALTTATGRAIAFAIALG